MYNIEYRLYKLYEPLAILIVNRLYPNRETEGSAAWMAHELKRSDYVVRAVLLLHIAVMMCVCAAWAVWVFIKYI